MMFFSVARGGLRIMETEISPRYHIDVRILIYIIALPKLTVFIIRTPPLGTAKKSPYGKESDRRG